MKIALNICGALIIGFIIIGSMKSCDPFSYLPSGDKPVLKGGVEQ